MSPVFEMRKKHELALSYNSRDFSHGTIQKNSREPTLHAYIHAPIYTVHFDDRGLGSGVPIHNGAIVLIKRQIHCSKKGNPLGKNEHFIENINEVCFISSVVHVLQKTLNSEQGAYKGKMQRSSREVA